MSTHTDGTRKRIRETVAQWRSAAHLLIRADDPGYRQDLQGDVVIASPKVYESGVITNLDLRLVDLYGKYATGRNPPPSASIERGIAC